MSLYKICGWFEVDGEMYDALLSHVETDGEVPKGWLFQNREEDDYGCYSFVHFGKYVSVEEQMSFLEFIIDCAKINTNYSDCPDHIIGEFVVAEQNAQVPTIRITIGNGRYKVVEV